MKKRKVVIIIVVTLIIVIAAVTAILLCNKKPKKNVDEEVTYGLEVYEKTITIVQFESNISKQACYFTGVDEDKKVIKGIIPYKCYTEGTVQKGYSIWTKGSYDSNGYYNVIEYKDSYEKKMRDDDPNVDKLSIKEQEVTITKGMTHVIEIDCKTSHTIQVSSNNSNVETKLITYSDTKYGIELSGKNVGQSAITVGCNNEYQMVFVEVVDNYNEFIEDTTCH